MNRIAVAGGALIFAGIAPTSAQTVIVDPGYAPPVYAIAPAPTYTVPVAPGPVFIAPAPTYVAPAVPIRRWHRRVVIEARPAWDVPPGVVYSDW